MDGVGEITIGDGFLSRVPGSEPPEWAGELKIWGYVYRLRGHVEFRGDVRGLVLRVVEQPKPVAAYERIEGFDND